jgi:hypothetical protein
MQECMPGASEHCYDGPKATKNVGICAEGTHTCQPDGSWGACDGEKLPQAETCVTKTDEDCDGKECALWSLISKNDLPVVVTGIAADSKANVIVFGAMQGTLTFGGDTLDASVSGPLFVAKFDPSGKLLWDKAFGGPALQMTLPNRTLALDSADNIYVAMNFSGTFSSFGTTFSADGMDFGLTKFTEDGTFVWSHPYGGSKDQYLSDLAVDTTGALRVVGEYTGHLELGATIVSDSGIFAGKISTSTGFVDSALTLGTGFSTPRLATGQGGAWALSGQCPTPATIGGKSVDPCDRFIAEFDASDKATWAVAVPGQPVQVAMDSTNSVLFVAAFQKTITFGQTTLTSVGANDIYVGRIKSADGAADWAKSWGGPGDEVSGTLSLDGKDGIYLSVNADDTIDFGGGALAGAGLNDAFIAALDAKGAHRWSRVFGNPTPQFGYIAARRDGGGVFMAVNTAGKMDFGAGALQSDAEAVALTELAP